MEHNTPLLYHSKRDDSIVKKNEKLISEIAVIKFKYNEILKENEKLKTLILKRPINLGLRDNPSLKYRNSSAKNKSLPKNNSTTSYITCNTLSTSSVNSASKPRNPTQNSNGKQNSNFVIKNLKKSFSIEHKPKNQSVNKRNVPNNNSKMVNMLTVSNQSNLSQLDNTTNNINSIKVNTNSNISFNNSFCNTTLANLVISFLSQMKSLQEGISNHSENVKEMKKKFELKKKELKKYSENLLGVSSAPSNFVTSNTNSLSTTPRTTSNPKKVAQNQAPPNSLSAQNQVSQLQSVIEKLNAEITKTKNDIVVKDEKIKNEKSISKLCEEKLNEEKAKNKNLTQENETIINEMKELKQFIQTQKETIDSLQKINATITESEGKQKEVIESLNLEMQRKIEQIEKLTINSSELSQKLKEQEDKAMNMEKDNITLKSEIAKLKLSISECNNNIITISNTNENIIKEKDKIISSLSNTIADLNNQIEKITSTKQTPIDNKDNKEEIENLNQQILVLKSQITSMNKENRELKSRIAEIKTEYVTHHDEEIELLKKSLVTLNDQSAFNLQQIREKKEKFNSIKEEFESKISNTQNYNSELMTELKNSTNEYINAVEMIKTSSKEIDVINKKIQIVLDNNTDSPDKVYEELIEENNKLKEENGKLKQIISQYQNKIVLLSSNRSTSNNNPNKTLSNINEQNSNFIDDELSSVSGIFIEDKTKDNDTELSPDKKKDTIEISINPNAKKEISKSDQPSTSTHTIINNDNTDILERKNSQGSLDYQSNLKMLVENETLLKNQLDLIKIELKKTREERDELKKKIEDVPLDKEELLTMLKQTFEKLIDSIQLVGKVKDYVMMILKLLNYSDDDISKILTKKDKKNNLFNIFK